MRRFLGHAVGIACALAVVSQAPFVMDQLVCALVRVGFMTMQDGCALGSSGLGEGGFYPAWSMVPTLLGLIGMMEVALWLQRLYSAPIWVPPLVVTLGCPTLLSVIAGLTLDEMSFLWEIGVVMGLPVALAFTAYCVPLRLLQANTRLEGGPQNNALQLTKPAQAMELRS